MAGGVDAAHPAAGEALRQPVDALAHVGGAGVGLGFVLLEPERLAGKPLGGDVAVAVVLEGGVAGGGDGAGLRGGAHVHPEQGRTQRAEVGVEADDSAAGAVGADADDGLLGQAALGHGLAGGVGEGGPPVVGALFGPA